MPLVFKKQPLGDVANKGFSIKTQKGMGAGDVFDRPSEDKEAVDRVCPPYVDPLTVTYAKRLSDEACKVEAEKTNLLKAGDYQKNKPRLEAIENYLDRLWDRYATNAQPFGVGGIDRFAGGGAPGSSEFTIYKGKGDEHVFALTPDQKWSNLPGIDRDESRHPLGDFVTAVVTGRREGLSAGVSAALGGGSGPGGGYLLPSALSSQVIDLARARSVLMEAGTQTILLNGDHLDIAKVSGDPAASVKVENGRFDDSTVTFSKITIQPRLMGIFVTVSRELVEDAANASQVIEMTMARALAAAIDKAGLDGVATASELNGILTDGDIDETDSTGAIDWTKLAAAAKAVRDNNHEPTSAIMSVANQHALGMSADLQERWLGPPPPLEPVAMLHTSAMPDSEIIVGDFANFALGLRSAARIEVSADAGETFQRHQVAIKAWWRGNFTTLDPSAFHKRTGVTV